MTRFAPATGLAKGDLLPPPTTGLPGAVLAPAGLIRRREISAPMPPGELHPWEPPSATALRLSTHREPARRDAYTLAPRCIPACRLTHRAQAPNSRRDAAFRVWHCLRRRCKTRLYRLQSIPLRARGSLVRRGDVHFLSFLE